MRRHENTPFVVNREVRAVIVPAGQEARLKPGQAGYVTQALGGSFTVYLEGNLFRIAGADADAIGQESVKAPELPPNANEEDVKQLAWEQMRSCYDPEIPINIVDLGLIYDAQSDDEGNVAVKMTLTTQGCPSAMAIPEQVRARIATIAEVRDVKVEIVWEPPWDPSRISPEGRKVLGLEA